MIKEGYDRKRPYVSGVVELEEGVRVVARIEGVDGSKPETIKIGTPLKVEFLHRGEGDRIATFLGIQAFLECWTATWLAQTSDRIA
jgi:uncharacterized OB-fold protein